jgi:hypothetical protein
MEPGPRGFFRIWPRARLLAWTAARLMARGLPGGAGGDQAALVGEDDELRAVAGAELDHRPADVGLGGGHLSPATLVHGHPAPSVTGMSLIHGYTTGFWVAAAIFGAGAVICGALFRSGPLRA